MHFVPSFCCQSKFFMVDDIHDYNLFSNSTDQRIFSGYLNMSLLLIDARWTHYYITGHVS